MKLPVPSVPDLVRLKGDTRDAIAIALRDFYAANGAPFNYISGTRGIKFGYKGLHDLKQLVASAAAENTAQGRKSNKEIISGAAPLAFNRNTSVFDLPRRQFTFGREYLASYRIPFFFVEGGLVKLYYLQPRKGAGLTYDQLCMMATIHKRYLLYTEFYGQPCDVEYVDVSAMPGDKERTVRQYSLADLHLWTDEKLADRLTLIAEALDQVQNDDTVPERRRRPPKPAADMPLF